MSEIITHLMSDQASFTSSTVFEHYTYKLTKGIKSENVKVCKTKEGIAATCNRKVTFF
jgi:hypothetical protein